MKTLEKAWRIVEYANAMGNDARDIRDAAHEAHHALDVGMNGKPWTRDNIHEALQASAEKRGRAALASMLSFELDARAVEKLVCVAIGLEYDDEHWQHIMWMETLSNMRVCLPHDGFISHGIAVRIESPRILASVRAILALADAPMPRQRR